MWDLSSLARDQTHTHYSGPLWDLDYWTAREVQHVYFLIISGYRRQEQNIIITSSLILPMHNEATH